jgi:two-component system, chemotaxis family, protein-glutamate methylesterase/glutaminase
VQTRAEVAVNGPEIMTRPVALTCPDCGGSMRQSELGTIVQFECHTGHRYTADVVENAQAAKLEETVEILLRQLNERIEMCRIVMARASAADGTRTREWQRVLNDTIARTLELKQSIAGV